MSKSKCSKDLYCAFLKVTSQRYSSLALSEVSPINLSHDSISRWLEEEHIRPKDIWNEAKSHILEGKGIIVADETVLNKNRSQKIELVRWQYSGDEHDIIRGIGMLNFLWVDEAGDVCPMDFRIWEPREDGYTKNDHFRKMLKEAKRKGVIYSSYSGLQLRSSKKRIRWGYTVNESCKLEFVRYTKGCGS